MPIYWGGGLWWRQRSAGEPIQSCEKLEESQLEGDVQKKLTLRKCDPVAGFNPSDQKKIKQNKP